jgi:hypothetical protein
MISLLYFPANEVEILVVSGFLCKVLLRSLDHDGDLVSFVNSPGTNICCSIFNTKNQ